MNIFSCILLAITAVNVFLAVFALRRERNKMTISYSAFMTCIAFYSFGYAFELSSITLADITFWLNIEYIGIPFFSPLFLVFTLYFTGNEKIISIPFLVFIFGISFITLFLHFTNYHNLFIVNHDLIYTKGFVLSNFSKGIWYWVHQAYFNIVVLICGFLFAKTMFISRGANQIRAAIMLFNTFLPWPFYLIYITGYSPSGIDISAFSLSFVGIIGSVGLMRFELLNFVPLAFSHIFDSMRDAVIVFDNENKLVNLNNSAKKILPSISNRIFHFDTDSSIADFPQLAALLQCENADKKDVELMVEGELRFFLASVSLIKKIDGEIQGKTLTLVDITERKQIENLLIKSESQLRDMNKAKDKFYELIAHDLRNPFNSLLNLSHFLKKSIENGDKEKSLLLAEAFNTSARNGFALLQNLLDWANMQQGMFLFNPQKHQLAQLVAEEVELARDVAKSKNIGIKVFIDDSITVFVDSNMIRSVVRNLLSNAIKYSFENQHVSLYAATDNSMVEISISDNGLGMTTEELGGLFSENKLNSKPGTKEEHGTGFGLKLCKEFVSVHKGKIGVESTVEKGSRFWFRIPIE